MRTSGAIIGRHTAVPRPRSRTHVLVAIVMLASTVTAAWAVHLTAERTSAARDDRVRVTAARSFQDRLGRHEDMLRAVAGLFNGSVLVTPAEFAAFTESTDIAANYPAVLALEVVGSRGRVVAGHYPAGVDRYPDARTDLLSVRNEGFGRLLARAVGDAPVQGAPLTEPSVLAIAAPVRIGSVPAQDGQVIAILDSGYMLDRAVLAGLDVVALSLQDDVTGGVLASSGTEVGSSALVVPLDTDLGDWSLGIRLDDDESVLQSYQGILLLVAGTLVSLVVAWLVIQIERSRRSALALAHTLRVSEERARSVVDNAPVAIVELVGDRVARANPRAHVMLGGDSVAEGRLLSSEVIDRDDGSRHPLLETVDSLHLAAARTPLLMLADGDNGAIEVIAERVALGADTSLLVLDDVTVLEDASRQAIRSQRMEAIGLLAGGVAHDFNNLLTIISGYTELVLASDHVRPADRQSLEESQRAAGRAAEVVAQLLTLTRRADVQAEIVDLNRAVRDMELMTRRVLGASIRLDLRLDPSPVLTRVDPGRFEQVMVNLVLNARDAMPDGGTLTISTRADGDWVVVQVADDGSGMAPRILERLFDPFFTTKASGSGLGLPMAATIIDEAGGRMDVASQMGDGSSFSIRLPLATPDPDDRVEAPRASAGPSTGRGPGTRARSRALAVDDEPALLGLLSAFLRGADLEVTTAVDAESAMDAAAADDPFDLLVTDVMLPGRSGLQLAADLLAAQPSLKVLVLSGYAEDMLPADGVLAMGAVLLRKPFYRDDLLAAVENLLHP